MAAPYGDENQKVAGVKVADALQGEYAVIASLEAEHFTVIGTANVEEDLEDRRNVQDAVAALTRAS